MSTCCWLELHSDTHDLHLSIIYVPRSTPFTKSWAVDYEAQITGEAIYGPPDKPVRVALAPLTSFLADLRGAAESDLYLAGIEWDRRWPFSPHITIRELPLPAGVRFTRCSWKSK